MWFPAKQQDVIALLTSKERKREAGGGTSVYSSCTISDNRNQHVSRTEKPDMSIKMEKEQVPGEDFVLLDAVFRMRPEQVGLQEEEDKLNTKYNLFSTTKMISKQINNNLRLGKMYPVFLIMRNIRRIKPRMFVLW